MGYCPPAVIFGFAPDSVDQVLRALFNQPSKKWKYRSFYISKAAAKITDAVFGEPVTWEMDISFAMAESSAFHRKSSFHDLGLTPSGVQEILHASQSGPIFYYHTDHPLEFEFEDTDQPELYTHDFKGFWGYRIFNDGQEIATAEFNTNWTKFTDSALEQALSKVTQTTNLEALSLFGLPDENIESLRQFMRYDSLVEKFLMQDQDEIRHELVSLLTLQDFYPQGAYPL